MYGRKLGKGEGGAGGLRLACDHSFTNQPAVKVTAVPSIVPLSHSVDAEVIQLASLKSMLRILGSTIKAACTGGFAGVAHKKSSYIYIYITVKG